MDLESPSSMIRKECQREVSHSKHYSRVTRLEVRGTLAVPENIEEEKV